jgi:hypothetical protein
VFLTAVIKFCVKLGKTQTEVYEILQNVCGDEALSRSSVFEWYKRFQNESEDIQDDPKSLRPSTT